jgi:hypothetical protein
MTDELLHLAARVLLRACPPLTTHAALRRVGRWLPQRCTRDEVLQASYALKPRGTCLSRALTIAATAPAADVVIGVDPARGTLKAHAWIELHGVPLHAEDPLGSEIARLSHAGAGIERR